MIVICFVIISLFDGSMLALKINAAYSALDSLFDMRIFVTSKYQFDFTLLIPCELSLVSL